MQRLRKITGGLKPATARHLVLIFSLLVFIIITFNHIMNLLMKGNIQVLCFIVVSNVIFCSQIEAQQKKQQLFMGKIVNASDKIPVSFGMIINTTSNQNAFSDSLGYFSILTSSTDTLVISRIGYFQKELVINESLMSQQKFHIIELAERSYELKAVNIEGLESYESLKYKVIHPELSKDEYLVNPSIKKSLSQKVVVLDPQMNISLGSPVTAIYMLLSKEGKSLRKLEKEEAKDREVDSYKQKYSPEIVSSLTGLKEIELEKFMKYCNIRPDFIKSAIEYEIAERILGCYKNYLAEKEKKEQ